MTLIFKAPTPGDDYTVKADDTLESIAKAKCPKLGWEALARLNFGTVKPPEVRRALAETVGVKVADLRDDALADKPETLKLAPDADLAPKLKIPQAWESDPLATEKKHTVRVKPVRPANAVGIVELDKWFIPDHETCTVKYRLEGLGDRADKLQFDVFGSNYCDCTAWNDGLGTFSDPAALIDEPIYTLDLAAQKAERTKYDALPGDGWKGQASTTKGMLGRKTGTAAARHVNVAFSPYTVHLRYWKANGDKTAHLVLEPFWPQWDEERATPAVTAADGGASVSLSWTNAAVVSHGALEVADAAGQVVHVADLPDAQLAAGAQTLTWDKSYRDDALNGKFEKAWIDDSAAVVPLTELLFQSTPYVHKVTTVKLKKKDASLEIKWEVRNTTKLERGQLLVFDGAGKLVFQKPLAKAKLGQGKQSFTWDGKYPAGVKNSKDGDEVIPEDMPYRVQVQAHTGIDQAEGLALAAMHSEVRLYVAKETRRPKDVRYDGWNAKPCVALATGPTVPGDPPAEGSGTEWYRHQLARLGFHPGPVFAGAAGDSDYRIAMREFKRSVPADGSVAAPNFTRLNLDASADIAENAETKTAIKTIRAGDTRKPFGDPAQILANNDAPDLSEAQAETALRDPAQEMAVWVDDRQYYTAETARDENNDVFLSGNAARNTFGLLNYRAGMTAGDGKATLDAAAIPRPWIPLKAELRLLGREDALHPAHDDAKVQVADAGLRAKMSRAIGPLRVDWTFDELPPDVSVIDPAAYSKDTSRPRKYVAWAIRQNQAAHTRKDTNRSRTYTNCTEALGGIRPASLPSYQEKAFGAGDLSLSPWKAEAVAATESIATVVHDHLTADQKSKKVLYEPLIGSAGAYFRPSIVAGDGYRVRAQVKFKKFGAYDFPNLDALRKRYPVRPHAHSARLRVWRRTTMRGYMCWGPATAHWPALVDGFRNQYKPAHVYFVHEGGAAQSYAVTDVFNPATPANVTTYKNIIKNNELVNATLQDTTKMQLRTADVWPWGHRNDMGWPWLSDQGVTLARLYDDYVSPDVISGTWRKFREGLLLALLKQVEKRGLLRGHLFVEFVASPRAFVHEYGCDNAAPHRFWSLQLGANTWRANGPCPEPGCAGPGPGPGPGTLRAKGTGRNYADGLPLPAVGVALGATWLFTTSNSETWAHEVGHHRHLEHSASAPGAEPTVHDSQNNSTQNWVTLGVADAADQNWDTKCTMSYADPPNLCFCGRCLLRNRGWKVTGLGFPAADVKEP